MVKTFKNYIDSDSKPNKNLKMHYPDFSKNKIYKR